LFLTLFWYNWCTITAVLDLFIAERTFLGVGERSPRRHSNERQSRSNERRSRNRSRDNRDTSIDLPVPPTERNPSRDRAEQQTEQARLEPIGASNPKTFDEQQGV